MMEFGRDVLMTAPLLMLGWAAIRRAEAVVIWAKRKAPGSDVGKVNRSSSTVGAGADRDNRDIAVHQRSR